MINVKTAVEIAFEQFQALYPKKKFEDVLLEEIELSPDKKIWMVTIGFARQMPPINIMESFSSKKYLRSFKMFRLDATTGELISMKNVTPELPGGDLPIAPPHRT